MRGEVAGRETGYACLDLESGQKRRGGLLGSPREEAATHERAATAPARACPL